VEYSRSQQFTGSFLCTQEAIRIMKRKRAARPHHQQRVHFRALAAPPQSPYTDQARHHGLPSVFRSTGGVRHRLLANRHWQRCDAMTERMAIGVLQQWHDNARAAARLRHVVDAVLYMAKLPEANVQLDRMATKMPLIGRVAVWPVLRSLSTSGSGCSIPNAAPL